MTKHTSNCTYEVGGSWCCTVDCLSMSEQQKYWLTEDERRRRDKIISSKAEIKKSKSTHPLPWRVGSKVPRNIYDANNVGIVMVGDEETARMIVEAVNSHENLKNLAIKVNDVFANSGLLDVL